MNDNISVIIVLYNPCREDTDSALNISKYYKGAIFDNSEHRTFEGENVNNMNYIWLGKNVGIAAAQNAAINSLADYKYIVFLDQDSRVDKDYPEKMACEYSMIKKQYPNLAILGPILFDGNADDAYISKIHKEKFLSPNVICRKNIISSGSCIRRDVLDDVGLNEVDLFIDLVDSEWCWRAVSKGYICCMTTKVKMLHTIGNKRINIGPIKDVVSSPWRYFYQYRNYLWMLTRSYVPVQWKFCVGLKSLLRLVYFPLFVHDGCKSWLFMVQGIWAGLMTIKK